MKFPTQQFMQFCKALKIDSKERGLISLGDSLLGTQRWVLEKIITGLEDDVHDFVTLKCLDPRTLVLKADLTWCQLRDIRVGDELVAFDENKPSPTTERKMRTARVLKKWSSVKRAYRITFKSGDEIIATADHRFLVQQWGGTVLQWKRVGDFRVGEKVRKVVSTWPEKSGFEDGWFGGIIDGEGHLRNTSVSGVGVGVTQVEGPVLDRITAYLNDNRYHFHLHIDKRKNSGGSSKLGNKDCHRLTVHRMDETFRLLGITRPVRMISNRWWEGRGLPGKKIPGLAFSQVESIVELDEREMIDIETTTGTFIAEGFASHNCRQAGISTISLALDLFWNMKHKGMSGMMAVHDEPSRDAFRATLELYYSSLPDEWKRGIKDHNRNQLVFTTGTRLLYRVAGTKKTGKGSLGRSAAISFLHATEMSSWGDSEGYASLRASLAQKNPNRLYHWESTARGFENLFYDQWEDATKAASQRAIFVSWWANEFYRIGREDPLYRIYYGPKGSMNAQERAWAREVKQLYGVEIDDEQIAWWRWLAAEQQSDESLRLQEYPWTETQAFQASGSQFFTATELSRLYTEVNKIPAPEYYRLNFKDNFIETQIVPSNAKNATLKVWKNPERHAFYVLGADPAYGSSENADGFAISVWRVWGDRAEQVCEYVDYQITTSHFAWAIAYLSGAYGPCTFNLEVNGPGAAVLNELQNMKKERAFGMSDSRPVLKDVMGSMRDFMYRKYDSIGGTPTSLHTVTNFQMKERMMNTFRDYVERKMALPVSRDLVSEMAVVQRENGSAPAAPDHKKDDRVIAAALAILAWNDQVRTRLMAQGLVYQNEQQQKIEAASGAVNVVGSRNVRNYMKDLGILYTKDKVANSNIKISRSRAVNRT